MSPSLVLAQVIERLYPPNITFRAISIADGSHSMIVGDSASIFTSIGPDNLRQWNPLPAPCSSKHTFYGVSFIDTLHAIIVADAGLIFTTSNAGVNWEPSGTGITNQTLRGLVHTAKGTLIVVGDSGIILRSSDSGITWNRVPSGTTHNIYAIAINRKGEGYFVGDHGSIGKTTDFGDTWPSVTDTITNLGANNLPIFFRSVDIQPISFSAVAVGDSGGIAATSDGITWQAVSATAFGYNNADSAIEEPILSKTCYYSVIYAGGTNYEWRITGDIDFYMVFPGPSVLKNGLDWQYVYWGYDADGGTDFSIERSHCQAIWRGSKTLLQFAGDNENNSTVDNFSTTVYSGIVGPGLTISPADFLYVNIDPTGHGFATAIGVTVAETNDNGLTWTAPLSSSITGLNLTDIYTIDSNNALAAGWSGIIARTSDHGASWAETQVDSNKERFHAIAHPDDKVYLVCGDFGTLYRSIDDAKSWTGINISSTAYLETMAFSSKDTGIAAGTNGTLLRTTDQGISWDSVNNPLTGGATSFRQLQAFPSGTYYVTTDQKGLYRSLDHGQDWESVPNATNTLGMEFFNEHIGVIAEMASCSIPNDSVQDSMKLAFTRDGFATSPIEFTIPIINNKRLAFHFLDSNTFLCYGSNAFIVKVSMSQGGLSVSQLPGSSNSDVQIYPNPASNDFRIVFGAKTNGTVTIQLFTEDGEQVETLFSGFELSGEHQYMFRIPNGLHGPLFVRIQKNNGTETIPLAIP